MTHAARTGLKAIITPVLVLGTLAACSPSYSPDTYASRAVQQANKVEQGVVVGRRQIEISADGTTGAVTGAAAGGVVGTRVGGGDITSAFAGIGGGLLGGLLGTAVEKGVGSSPGFEYVVRKPNGELVSVTQRDETPLAIGQKVLVIAGAQARIVPDYTVPNESPPGPAPTPDGSVPASPATAASPAAPLPAAPAQESLPPPQQAPAEAPAESPPPAPLPAPATLPARPELPGVPQLAI